MAALRCAGGALSQESTTGLSARHGADYRLMYTHFGDSKTRGMGDNTEDFRVWFPLPEIFESKDWMMQEQTSQEQTQLQGKKTSATILLVFLFIVGAVSYLGFETQGRQAQKQREEMTSQVQMSPKAWTLTPEMLVLLRAPGGETTVHPFAEIPEGETVEVGYKDLYAGAKTEATWKVVKHGGRPYLRAYLPAPMPADALQQGNVWITNTARPGLRVSSRPTSPAGDSGQAEELLFVADKPTPITVPLESLRFHGDAGRIDQSFLYTKVVSGIEPDSHLQEPWK
jgi:hypothetical protein